MRDEPIGIRDWRDEGRGEMDEGRDEGPRLWWIQRETDDHWLICYEACIFREDALRRERVLKSYQGKMFIRNRLKSYLAG